jgi:tetratricopeptide (TPR) repeat protein
VRTLAPALLCAGAVVFACASASAADAETLCRQAKALKDAGKLEAAAAAYREAIGLAPESVEAHWGLAWVYRKQGLRDPAAAEFARVIELATDAALAQEAREALRRMGAAPPGSPPVTPPPAPTQVSLAAARELIGLSRAADALRVLRALVAEGIDRAEAERLIAEVKRGRRLVRVRAAADPVFRSLPAWEERLRARFAAATAELSRQVPIDFELVSVQPWVPSATTADGMDIIEDLQTGVPREDVDVVVGFTAERRNAPPEGERLEVRGYTFGLAPCFTGTVVVSEVVAGREGREWRVPDTTLRENLVHELGHLFGAVHARGDSVMRTQPSGAPVYDFDPLNVRVIQACRWVDFREEFASLSRDELEQLAQAYDDLAQGPAADDGVHFYRAIALTFLERYEEAIAEYNRVLATSRSDAYTHVNLAKLYEARGDMKEARSHWAIAVGLGRPAEVAREAREALDRLGGS